VKYVLENADRVLTVDDGLKRDAIKNLGVDGKNIQTVPTGYDYEKFKPEGEKENLVISVSIGDNWERIRLKGLDTFVKSAEFLPDVKFLVIGIQGDALNKLQDVATSNVEFTGFISDEKLLRYYQKAKVYCQLSMREGLPTALCEAMLCECVPVGTDVQGVRTAIGNAGFYVPYSDEKATAEAIKKALKSNKGKEARERIRNMFPMEKREKELIEIIKGCA
jgi:glycosyltransferase involved in cell wall biosynthesis